MATIAAFIEKEGALTPGEQALLAGLGSGDFVPIGGVDLPPENAGDERVIRASLLRELILGAFTDLADFDGTRLHEKGVQLAGARITGVLGLEGCRIDHDIALVSCRFEAAPVLRSAVIDSLFLNESHLPGIEGDRMKARGSVVLRGVQAEGEVRFLWAKLEGSFDCEGAILTASSGEFALFADGIDARGGLSLRGATLIGEGRLLGAKLGANLDCDGATVKGLSAEHALAADGLVARGSVLLRGAKFEGALRLVGMKLGGDLSCLGTRLSAGRDGFALNLRGAEIDGAFFLRDGTRVDGVLDLTGAECGMLVDEEPSWPKPGNLILNRCRYGAFIGKDIGAEARIRWLGLQNEARFGHEFWPQPWEQCAQVLRKMGHRGDARAILIEKEKRQRAAARARLRRGHLYEDAYWRGVS